MTKEKKESSHARNPENYYLDISGETCPMTFVKTKLVIEKMLVDDTLEIRLGGTEPLSNIPRSVETLGQKVLSMTPEPGQEPDGFHRLVLKKTQFR